MEHASPSQTKIPVPILRARRYVAATASPRTGMKKYWHVINVGIQNNLTYRFNYLARTLFGLIPLTAVLFLVNEDDWQIAADIKDGNISQFLLKPVDYLWFRLCLFLSGRLTYMAVAFIPLTLFILYLREYFVAPANWATFGLFVVSLGLTALLQFFISYMMAMLAFWVLEVSTFIFILYAFEYIASGHLFPLDILPPALERALYFTPFPYQLYFPVGLYMGKTTGAELARGFGMQIFWVLFAYGAARFAWQRGIKKYAAVGG